MPSEFNNADLGSRFLTTTEANPYEMFSANWVMRRKKARALVESDANNDRKILANAQAPSRSAFLAQYVEKEPCSEDSSSATSAVAECATCERPVANQEYWQ